MSPTFRAEKSDTPRHLSEFYMLEAEMQFLNGGLDELLDQTEGIIRDITAKLAGTKAAKEILTAKRSGESGQDEGADDMLQQRWDGILHPSKWPRVTYTEAITVLQEAVDKGEVHFVYPPTWGNPLQFEHEKYIVEKIGGSGSGRPVFITHYPKASKPFYMLPSSIAEEYEEQVGDKATVGAFDLILPGIGEILGGSMREHRLPNLIQNMRENGLIKKKATEGTEGTDAELYPYLEAGESLEPLQWYADLRRWGSAPHGGWGLGFDRFLGYLSGVGNLRDVVAFPRYAGKADC
ncbi:Asparaginyl-tRNA synthetase [Ascosphaera pollenicola]|nr:Asparaginyl-tRNA synthetase [Ascosphaera pollenicola]